MNNLPATLLTAILILGGCTGKHAVYKGLESDIIIAEKDTILKDSIVYHPVRVDKRGDILPWYSADPGQSYDHVLHLVWDFWKNMPADSNGQKYYMNHQVWRPQHDKRGLGGDQVMMALSSWDLYYDYTGDESVIENMKYMADYYLTHSLSAPGSKWPDLPYPYNNNVESGIYDGDMILGTGYLQPDKAGSFGFELVKLFAKTSEEKYLDAALKIANTLAGNVKTGDGNNSPWPFKLNAVTGETGILVNHEIWYEGMAKDIKKANPQNKKSSYTTNWTGTLDLFNELIGLHRGDTAAYKKAFGLALDWMKTYPAKTNKWGPFFEDVPRWSDTQINAVTYAIYVLEHPELDSNWRQTAKNIFEWVHKELGNKEFNKYGVTVTDQETAYRVPGNSHSAREAAAELMYWEKSGDTSYVRNAVRQLNWATYMVDHDGKNFYPTNDVWLTDGYGDYSRHYLRAMAAAPQLAPANSDHLLRSSSVISRIVYEPAVISYTTFDSCSEELFRMNLKPKAVKTGGNTLTERAGNAEEGWSWQTLDKGGVLKIKHTTGRNTEIVK